MAFRIVVKSDINFSKFTQNKERADEELRDAVLRDTEPFVPMATGYLAGSGHTTGDGIEYTAPYAHYLYEGKAMVDSRTGSAWAKAGHSKRYNGKSLKISKAVHGKASSKWMEPSIAKNMSDWERLYKDVLING